MRMPIAPLCAAGRLALIPEPGQAGDRETEAVKAAEAWLAVVDAGGYATSLPGAPDGVWRVSGYLVR